MNFFTAWVACGGILATQLCRFSSLLGELFLPVGSSPVTGLVPLSDYKGKEGRRGLRGDLNPPVAGTRPDSDPWNHLPRGKLCISCYECTPCFLPRRYDCILRNSEFSVVYGLHNELSNSAGARKWTSDAFKGRFTGASLDFFIDPPDNRLKEEGRQTSPEPPWLFSLTRKKRFSKHLKSNCRGDFQHIFRFSPTNCEWITWYKLTFLLPTLYLFYLVQRSLSAVNWRAQEIVCLKLGPVSVVPSFSLSCSKSQIGMFFITCHFSCLAL